MESALRNWEFDNLVEIVDPIQDALYTYDSAEQQQLLKDKPYKREPRYFKDVRISAVALLKMVMHARSGGSLEVMGLMQGKISGTSFIVTDAFRLPVEGTETRVNAQDEANEYMPEYLQLSRDAGQMENAVGWYHSHPGYGCWLSGIDVETQATHQKHYDPYLAVVIDPDRTISAGKVEIGAFRTWPDNYTPPETGGSTTTDDQPSIPMAKIDDFGAHSSRYYSLEVSHFKSTLDTHLLELLWKKYWVSTLSQSALLTNRDYTTKQMRDLSEKILKTEQMLANSSKSQRKPALHDLMAYPNTEGQLDKVTRESNRVVADEVMGLLSTTIKERLFNGVIPSADAPMAVDPA
ncbi:MAG: COP9 signalosome catalytic subunit rri1 [Watsoniomyces obsoletus]|nr:MAG: COP9 signalosome catalytic subunit rri1 [Watsoniomyces obsoletus]